MKTAIIFTLAILTTGCTAQVQTRSPETIEAPASTESDSPCLDALKASAGAAYEATKEKVKESQEDGILKDVEDKYEELKGRAGKAYDAFMEDDDED